MRSEMKRQRRVKACQAKSKSLSIKLFTSPSMRILSNDYNCSKKNSTSKSGQFKKLQLLKRLNSSQSYRKTKCRFKSYPSLRSIESSWSMLRSRCARRRYSWTDISLRPLTMRDSPFSIESASLSRPSSRNFSRSRSRIWKLTSWLTKTF